MQFELRVIEQAMPSQLGLTLCDRSASETLKMMGWQEPCIKENGCFWPTINPP